MHLVIISGTPRVRAKSNTARIIEAFKKGFIDDNNTTEEYFLSDRKQWESAKKAFDSNENVLFATALFVENIPGIMLEFLETLTPKNYSGTKLFFLIQGGFEEASQLRCAEEYLEKLPKYLGCDYGGTLIKGGMFGLQLMGPKIESKMLEGFVEIGRKFKGKEVFTKDMVNEFAGPEYLDEKVIKKFNRFGKYLQKFFMGKIAKKLGCKVKLNDRPYQEYLEQK